MFLLDSTVQEPFIAGLAPATLKVHKSDSKRYHSFCDMYINDARMPWAAATMCFLGFACREVVTPTDSSFDPNVHLTAGDMSVDSHSSPSYLAVRIKASKTDPFRQGVTMYLGRTNYCICPVAAVLSYLIKKEWTPGPLFTFIDGHYLTRNKFVKAVRDAVVVSGIGPSKYAGHSFRIGAATTAASSGVQDSLIMTMGCTKE